MRHVSHTKLSAYGQGTLAFLVCAYGRHSSHGDGMVRKSFRFQLLNSSRQSSIKLYNRKSNIGIMVAVGGKSIYFLVLPLLLYFLTTSHH